MNRDEEDYTLLIISDVHGLLEELLEFTERIIETESISFIIQLGDFFKGRNIIGGNRTYTFWKDPSILEKFPVPILSVKGNEDLNIPEDWWNRGMMMLLPHLGRFKIEDLETISVHYIPREMPPDSLGIKEIREIPRRELPRGSTENTYYPRFTFIPTEENELHPIFRGRKPIIPSEGGRAPHLVDIIFSHVPPFGLLDKTRDAITHKEVRLTGDKLVRLIIDLYHPKLVFFGHNHFANFRKYGDTLVISCDKFCRKIPDRPPPRKNKRIDIGTRSASAVIGRLGGYNGGEAPDISSESEEKIGEYWSGADERDNTETAGIGGYRTAPFFGSYGYKMGMLGGNKTTPYDIRNTRSVYETTDHGREIYGRIFNGFSKGYSAAYFIEKIRRKENGPPIQLSVFNGSTYGHPVKRSSGRKKKRSGYLKNKKNGNHGGWNTKHVGIGERNLFSYILFRKIGPTYTIEMYRREKLIFTHTFIEEKD